MASSLSHFSTGRGKDAGARGGCPPSQQPQNQRLSQAQELLNRKNENKTTVDSAIGSAIAVTHEKPFRDLARTHASFEVCNDKGYCLLVRHDVPDAVATQQQEVVVRRSGDRGHVGGNGDLLLFWPVVDEK
jgi:hypothetical protein